MLQETAKTPDEKLCVKLDDFRLDSKNQLRMLRTRWIDSLKDYRPQNASGNQRDGVGHRKLQKKRAGNELLENGAGNRIASIIDQQISMIYDNNPRAFFLPKETEDLSYAKQLESLTKWRLDRIDIRTKLIQGGLYAKLFGFQAFHVYWDDTLPDDPDANARVLWPESLIIDPRLETQNPEEGDFVGYDRLVSLDYAISKWPRKKKQIEEEMNVANEGAVSTVLGGGNDNSDMLQRELGHGSQGTIDKAMRSGQDQVQMTVIWFKDYSQNVYRIKQPIQELIEKGDIVEHEINGTHIWANTGQEVTDESIPTVTVKTPKYPYGRHVIKIGTIILEDYPWGYDPDTAEIKRRSWPIALAVNKLIPGVWYGQDECEALRADQNVADVMLQNITEHAYSSARPVREIDSSKMKQTKEKMLNQLHDGIVVSNGKSGMTTHNPGQISNDVYNMHKLSTTNMEITAGISGQSIGREGSSQQTATEIAALQRASRGKVGITSAFVDALVNRIYNLTAECIQFNYDEGRIVRVLGESTDSQMTSVQMTRYLKDVKFDVETEAGSTLPNDKQQKKVEANEVMAQVGLPYLPNFLEAYEVKNKDEVLQSHQEYQMFLQFAPILQDPNVQALLTDYMAQLEASGQAQPQA